MCCIGSHFFNLIVLAGLFAAPAASEEAKPLALMYSPWTKVCLGGSCYIGKNVHTECGLVGEAVLFEKTGAEKKTLRVILPATVSVERGVRIVIDRSQPIARPYVGCSRSGCMADHEGGMELVDQLKQGQKLVLEGVNAANSAISLSMPLAGFADAYDGPQIEPRILEERVLSLKEMQQQKLDEAARKSRCDPTQ
jgi:invasion protein IalB